MSVLQVAVILVAVAAGALARRHRMLRLVLLRVAVVDVARELLGRFVLRPERARLLDLVHGDETIRAPFSGAVRFAYNVEQVLYLSGPAAVAMFAAWAFTRPPRRLPLAAVAIGWTVSSAMVAYLYPELSGLAWARWPIGPVYRVAHVAAALVSAAAFAIWIRHRERPELRHRAALTLAGGELLVAFAGPYAWGGAQGVWTRWTLAGIIYFVTLARVGWYCWRERDTRQTTRAD